MLLFPGCLARCQVFTNLFGSLQLAGAGLSPPGFDGLAGAGIPSLVILE
jgi:hypothetical protein